MEKRAHTIEKKKKMNAGQILLMAGAAVIGGLGGFFGMDMMESAFGETISIWQIFLVLLMFGAAWYLQIAIHEGGHLVFGLLSGYRFVSYRLGSLMWQKQDGKLRLRRFFVAGTGGQCLMAPPEPDESGVYPYALYHLGGVIANLVTSAAAVLAALLGWKWIYLRIFCLLFAFVGVASALLNGIPMRLGLLPNDGYNAWMLGRHPLALRVCWIQLRMNALIARGASLTEMPQEWFVMPAEEELRDSLVASQAVFVCNRLMAQRAFAEADAQMAWLLSADTKLPEIYRRLLTNDRIYCALTGVQTACETDGDAAARRERLEALRDRTQRQFERQMKNYPSVLRTQYAWALLQEKDQEKALDILKKYDKIAKSYPYPQDAAEERALMERAERYAAAADGSVPETVDGGEEHMYIIVGLGNPGSKYAHTRHNVGFDTIDVLADRYRIAVDTKKFKALIGKGVIEGQRVVLAKPQTFMNLSGESVRELIDFYKIDETSELIVIYDDISLEPGQLRIRTKGSAGGHNGIKNIIAHLGGQEFLRIKVGVGERPRDFDLADYVLSRFHGDEREVMDKAFERAAKAAAALTTQDTEAVMNEYNRKA